MHRERPRQSERHLVRGLGSSVEGLELAQVQAAPGVWGLGFSERHLAAHHAAFPEGQHCAIDEATNEVLGMNCTLLLDRCVAEG